MVINNCGGWGGTWSKRKRLRLYRRRLRAMLRLYGPQTVLPLLREVVQKDMYKPQYRAWIRPQQHGVYRDRLLRK